MTEGRHVIVTGAAGFIGAALTRRLLVDPAFEGARISICDLDLSNAPRDPRVRLVEGDLCDPAVRGRLLDNGADLVFHLAGVLGGAAEVDYDLARRVNVDATVSLFEALRRPERPPRIVFASSIAVFGPPQAKHHDDDTPPAPILNYGAQKLMAEVALLQFTARGWIDGVALRLPGIVARSGADARLKSAFLNRVFFAIASGENFTMPVSAHGTSWLISGPACIDALIHAAVLPRDGIGCRRAFVLPAQRVRIGDLVSAIKRRHRSSPAIVAYRPDRVLQAQFASHPELSTTVADSLGFVHDGDLDTLVARAYAGTIH